MASVVSAEPRIIVQRRGGRWLRRNTRLWSGFLLLGMMIAVASAAPLLARADPLATDATALGVAPGSAGHLFGTDALGRDLLARVLYGGRVSLLVGGLAATLSLLLGVGVGALAGFGPGWLDSVLMRVVDALLALPLLVLIIAVQAVARPSVLTVVLVIGASGWLAVARVVRAEFLSLRHRPFTEAAQALGAPPWRVALRHILPNALPPILAIAGFQVGGAILTETSLSFLGLGVPAQTPTWGNILTQSKDYLLLGQWWALAWPAGAIALTAIGVNLIADSLRLQNRRQR